MYQKHPTKLKCKRKHMQTSSKRKQSCRENEKTEICKKLTCWECCKCSYTSVLRCMSKTAFKCQERPCLQCRRYAYAKASVGSRTVVNRYQSWVLPYFKSFARNSQVRISLQNSTIANVMLKVGASIKSFLGLQDLDYLYAGCRFAGEANPSEEHVCTCALATCNLPTALPREKARLSSCKGRGPVHRHRDTLHSWIYPVAKQGKKSNQEKNSVHIRRTRSANSPLSAHDVYCRSVRAKSATQIRKKNQVHTADRSKAQCRST